MNVLIDRRQFLGSVGSLLAWFAIPTVAQSDPRDAKGDQQKKSAADDQRPPRDLLAVAGLSLVLGRITHRSVTASTLVTEPGEGYFEYGPGSGHYSNKTGVITFPAGEPVEVVFENLQPNTEYFYRLHYRQSRDAAFHAQSECQFHTQRPPGSAFTFGIQGDSHPERPQMYDSELYARSLRHAATGKPDFYICMGDDFSVDTLRTITATTVAERYTIQRPFLGLVAQSAPLFLVNGNHEQASLFNYNQTDDRHDVAVWAQTARNRYYPLPAPDGFYTGDTDLVQSIGLLRDYYAWTWGDALFVVLDNYWHSPARVDNPLHEKPGADKEWPGGNKDHDWWGISLGEAQYQWFKHTLEQSSAKYKFVFAHHVLGTGRGGVDETDLYEWGGQNRRGDSEFGQHRPGWELPIHQLMVKHGVTVFFQGHDHLYARQERDGIIYQEVPMPADPAYLTRNADRYQSGIKLPNSGHLRVTVTPVQVQVDYVRCFLPKNETDQQKTGTVAYSYTIPAKRPGGAA